MKNPDSQARPFMPPNPLVQLVPQRVRHARNQMGQGLFRKRRRLMVEGGPFTENPTSYAEALEQSYEPVARNEHFGAKLWGMRWFRLEIPAAQPDEEGRRLLEWDSNGETNAWIDRQPWAGLDQCHPYCPLPDKACVIHLATGTWQTGIWGTGWPFSYPGYDSEQGCRFKEARLSLRDEPLWQAYHDMDTLVNLLDHHLKKAGVPVVHSSGYSPPLFELPVTARRLLQGLDRVADAWDTGGVEAAQPLLTQLYAELQEDSDLAGSAALIGHAHMDLVWLWPEAATEHKVVHTTATLMRLWDRYPELTFSGTQIPWYDYLRKHSPELLEQARKKIAEGKWEASGATEVESDVTLPSGEGLARAFLYGQQAFKELRGGTYARMLWIPDVFGYSACLPQLAKQSGVDWFYTTKMHWSGVTRFPYTTFRWRGHDGSEILTHITPRNYNGSVDLSDTCAMLERHQQSASHGDLLLPTGRGDGGGGPDEAMMERARRLKRLAGVPKASWTTGEAFFERIEKRRQDLPAYQGELYLEYHRGTYTTQGQLKYLYRAAEKALQAHEAARTLAGGPALPAADWKRAVFAQFHDALPGSSITRVYDELNSELAGLGERHREAAAKELSGRENGLLLANSVALPRRAAIVVAADDAGALGLRPSAQAVSTPQGASLPAQPLDKGRWLVAADLPALGTVRLTGPGDASPPNPLSASPERLDNGLACAAFANGQLRSLRVEGEELDVRGAGLRIYPDNPAQYDAWDIDRGALALGQPCADAFNLEVVEAGPVRATLRGTAALGDGSKAAISFSLVAGSPWLDVQIDIDWREDHKLLKYHVATGYLGRWTRYGAPFGSIDRPQLAGYNNDESQWEVAGQRWAAVTDQDRQRGLAVVTEAKYGFSCRDGDLGLSLLRASRHPDPVHDRGRHVIRFAIGRHRDRSNENRLSTAAEAEDRYAETIQAKGGRDLEPPFAYENLGSLVPAAAKPAEDGDGIVLRLHETAGGRGTAALVLKKDIRSVALVDILERPAGELERGAPGRFKIPYAPYQLISLKIPRP